MDFSDSEGGISLLDCSMLFLAATTGASLAACAIYILYYLYFASFSSVASLIFFKSLATNVYLSSNKLLQSSLNRALKLSLIVSASGFIFGWFFDAS